MKYLLSCYVKWDQHIRFLSGHCVWSELEKVYNIQNPELISSATNHDKMGLAATKPVFGVSDKERFKPACSATETS